MTRDVDGVSRELHSVSICTHLEAAEPAQSTSKVQRVMSVRQRMS